MTTKNLTIREIVDRMTASHINRRLDQQRAFFHKLIDASGGQCPDCGESIPDCWDQLVARTHDTTNLTIFGGYLVGSPAPAADWIGMRATCSGAETWLRLEGLV